MPMHKSNSRKRWAITGLAGLVALTLASCGKIPQDGTSGNKAGKNVYIKSFAPATYRTADGTLTDNSCGTTGPTIMWSSTYAYLSDSNSVFSWIVVKNDMKATTAATEPENQVFHIDRIGVEYEVTGATAQIPAYEEIIGYTLSPGGIVCLGAYVLPYSAKDFINRNRSAFPRNETTAHFFQVKAKVKVVGYETNGGTRIDTPTSVFTIDVYNSSS